LCGMGVGQAARRCSEPVVGTMGCRASRDRWGVLGAQAPVPPGRALSYACDSNQLGLWALLAGWSVAGALSDFPWPVALHLVPLIVGLHVPLALTWDRWPSSQRRLLRHLGYDRAAGLRTVAVALGTGPAKKLGWALWLLYLFGLMRASALGYGLPRTLLYAASLERAVWAI
jgi:hypothetical protein